MKMMNRCKLLHKNQEKCNQEALSAADNINYNIYAKIRYIESSPKYHWNHSGKYEVNQALVRSLEQSPQVLESIPWEIAVKG